MVTGSPQVKHKLFYAVLNVYDGKKRKHKWIPTGLKERGNKKTAQEITLQLTQLFNRDGTIKEKYLLSLNPMEKIQSIYKLPNVTLNSLNKIIYPDSNDKKGKINISAAAKIPKEKVKILNMLFCDYLVLWLERLAPNLEENTYGAYRRNIHGRIYNYFHHLGVSVESLEPEHIEMFYQGLSNDENLSPNSIIHYHNNIRKALQQLYLKQIIPNNPADLICNRPVREDYSANYFNEEQINEYIQIVKGTKMELPVLGAAFYGFRRSEILGIKDSAVNFSNKKLIIKHTVTQSFVEGETKIIRKDKIKNKSSLRSMPLVDIMETAIIESCERQSYYKQTNKLYSTADQHYLCRDENGKLLTPNFITVKHKELLEKHNLPHIRFHDLRHSCATLLISKGIPLEKIKEWLGHADITMTERYAHLDVSTAKNEMAVVMSNVIKGMYNSN